MIDYLYYSWLDWSVLGTLQFNTAGLIVQCKIWYTQCSTAGYTCTVQCTIHYTQCSTHTASTVCNTVHRVLTATCEPEHISATHRPSDITHRKSCDSGSRWHVKCHMLHITCHIWYYVAYDISHVTFNTDKCEHRGRAVILRGWNVTYHVQDVTSNVSHVICDILHCHMYTHICNKT